MASTVIRGAQIKDSTVQRHDLDTSTVGQAVVTKIVQGSGITLSSTGSDSGTGDVTVAASAIPLASNAQSGLLNQTSGNTTDYVGGDNACHSLNRPLLLGETSADPTFPTGIVVPRYAAHPDALWTYNAFDDHFDGSVLNAKWNTRVTAGNAANQKLVGGSFVSLEIYAAASGGFENTIWQNLPAGTTWDLRVHMRGLATCSASANSNGYWQITIGRNATSGVSVGYELAPNSTGIPYPLIYINVGTGFATSLASVYAVGFVPEYWRINYLASKVTNVYWSLDGVNWSLPSVVTAAQSGLSSPPTLFQLQTWAYTSTDTQLSSDWVRCIYS